MCYLCWRVFLGRVLWSICCKYCNIFETGSVQIFSCKELVRVLPAPNPYYQRCMFSASLNRYRIHWWVLNISIIFVELGNSQFNSLKTHTVKTKGPQKQIMLCEQQHAQHRPPLETSQTQKESLRFLEGPQLDSWDHLQPSMLGDFFLWSIADRAH